MADGQYRFQQGAGPFYYSQHYHQSQQPQHRVLRRNVSPIRTGRTGFTGDTPSPTRSPGPISPLQNFYSNMYNQGHPQSQHGVMNGASTHQRLMQMNVTAKQFQHQNLQHQNHHQPQHHMQHHDHGGHGMHNNFGNHQHTLSGGPMSNHTPSFTPNHMHNGTPNNIQGGLSKPLNEHWAKQMELAQLAREATIGHYHARNSPSVNKSILAGSANSIAKETDKGERNRAAASGSVSSSQIWLALDIGGQNIRTISPALFNYTFLDKLYLNNNKLTYLPPAIGRLRNLTHLDLSLNELRQLPPEIGVLVNLRELSLVDNRLNTLPYEMGSLYQLEMLGIEGNPLDEELKLIIAEHGIVELIKHLREQAEVPTPPSERDWIVLDDTPVASHEKVSALSYNILCEKYASQSQYGYTPSAALSWEYRKTAVLEELRARDADIVCLQEIDVESYQDYFRPLLALKDYKGVFWPKSRARTMAEKDAKLVDGCATFYKGSRYILLDKQLVDFANIAINRPDMKGEHDIFNRVMPRDNIAVVTFFEERITGARLICVNAHVHWDPAFKDVKLVQVAILMEQISKFADKYAKWPPCTDKTMNRHKYGEEGDKEDLEKPTPEPGPSLEYSSGSAIPMIMCGDFNSFPDSGVCDLLAHGSLSHTHSDLEDRKYGNFTRDGMAHPFTLKSSYAAIGELAFTNYTPNFAGVIDYIWYSTNGLHLTGLLGEIDREYLQKVPGFPNYHFPSDHLALFAEFSVKPQKEKKAVGADFGTQKEKDKR